MPSLAPEAETAELPLSPEVTYGTGRATPHGPARTPQHDTPAYGRPAYDAPAPDSHAYGPSPYDAPAYDAQAYDAPPYDAQAYDGPGYDAAPHDAPTYDAPAYDAAPHDAPAYATAHRTHLSPADAHRLALQAKLTEIGVPPGPEDRGALRQLAALDSDSVTAVVRWLACAAGTFTLGSAPAPGAGGAPGTGGTGDCGDAPPNPADRIDPRLLAW